MNIGELFVTLGLKGGDKVNKDLTKTKDNMVGLTKKTLGAIGALAGVSIGLSAIYNRAINSGVGLNKFSNYLGQSSKELQKWQYIAMDAGVAANEVDNTFRRISEAAGDFELTGNLPAELSKIASVIGGIDLSKLGDADYMLRNIQKFLQSGSMPQNVLNSVASALVSPEMIQFLNQNQKDPSLVPDSAIMADSTAKALNNSKVELDKFLKDIEVRFAKLFVKIGPKILPKLRELAVEIVNLTEAMINFLSNNKIFDMLSHIIKALTLALKGDIWKASEEMAKFGDLQADVMRGGWYEDMVKNYVTPVVRPITNTADSVVTNAIEIYQDIKVQQGVNREEGMRRAAREGALQGTKKAISQSK